MEYLAILKHNKIFGISCVILTLIICRPTDRIELAFQHLNASPSAEVAVDSEYSSKKAGCSDRDLSCKSSNQARSQGGSQGSQDPRILPMEETTSKNCFENIKTY